MFHLTREEYDVIESFFKCFKDSSEKIMTKDLVFNWKSCFHKKEYFPDELLFYKRIQALKQTSLSKQEFLQIFSLDLKEVHKIIQKADFDLIFNYISQGKDEIQAEHLKSLIDKKSKYFNLRSEKFYFGRYKVDLNTSACNI